MKRFAIAGRLPGGAATLGVDAGLLHQRSGPDASVWPNLALGELTARMVIVALFTFMAVRIGADFLHTGRITGLLLVASEALVVVLTVFRRPAQAVDRSIPACVLTTLSLMGPSLVMPAAVAALMPAFVTVTISACGLLIVICGKLSLGRSFGLMPANRGVVSTGLYRLVRHPIYLGYLITHAGFVAANPTIWNVLSLVGADVALLVRAVYEERTLARDVMYRAYQAQVRWRVLPGVF
jgi:protein-S-isoprenylcysteine O-methyltransferase Ste14